MAETMRSARGSTPGGAEVVSIVEVEAPGAPGAGEVVVRVATAGVSLPDMLLLAGTYPGVPHTPPQAFGIEYAGTV